uniref:Uncharacterized protein n=1 Tax=Anguilla anguilla TaxID=7936 RepID=A0A0E9WBE2_ANGAN
MGFSLICATARL